MKNTTNQFLIFGVLVLIILLAIIAVYYFYAQTQTQSKGTLNPSINKPPIYCLMMTGKDESRFNYAIKSINNFLEQTYSDKYLLILNHGKPLNVTSTGARIFEIPIDKEGQQLTLGDMRNIAYELVPFNALWITWDDDDYRAPNLLNELHSVMVQKDADMVCITKRLEFNINTDLVWKMTVKNGMIFGLSKKLGSFQYLRKDSMEDVQLIDTYEKAGKKVVRYDNDPKLYIRVVHENNTSMYVDKDKTAVRVGSAGNYVEEQASEEDQQYVRGKIIL